TLTSTRSLFHQSVQQHQMHFSLGLLIKYFDTEIRILPINSSSSIKIIKNQMNIAILLLQLQIESFRRVYTIFTDRKPALEKMAMMLTDPSFLNHSG
ncbi:unnamed protein product, partial [Rotaria magnacalcarata]